MLCDILLNLCTKPLTGVHRPTCVCPLYVTSLRSVCFIFLSMLLFMSFYVEGWSALSFFYNREMHLFSYSCS